MSDAEESEPAEEKPAPDSALSPAVADSLQAVQKALEELAALLGADSAATLDVLKQAGQAASENLVGMAEEARDLSRAKVDDVEAAVRRHPLAWLAAAVGLGLIVGLWRNRGPRP